MSEVRCPQCRGTMLCLFALGVVEWDGERWEFTGETTKAWLSCECGHSWRTKRDPGRLAVQMKVERHVYSGRE